MVADGYWLRTADTDWRRVTLADYVEAMQAAGFRVEPPAGTIGYGGRVRDFKAGGIRGTVIDPHSQPAREIPRLAATGRTLTPDEAARFREELTQAFQPLAAAAAQFLQQLATAVGPALAELNRTLQEVEQQRRQQCNTETTPPSGGPSPTPTGLGWPSKPASDAANPTGTTSTDSSSR